MRGPQHGGRGRRERAASGFTLMELMVVVVIIGILAAVALPTYMRHRYRSQALEAAEVLSQVAAAQEAYRAEHGQYSDASNDPGLAGTASGTTGALGTWWPARGAAAASATGQVDFYTGLPAAWNQLGVRPRRFVRYSYQTIAGNPGVAPSVGASGNLGYSSLPTAQQGSWYYAAATGDLDRDGTFSIFEVSSLTRTVNVVGSELE